MKRKIEPIRTNKPLYALNQPSKRTDHNIGIGILFFTLWVVFVGYLANASLGGEYADIHHTQKNKLEDIK